MICGCMEQVHISPEVDSAVWSGSFIEVVSAGAMFDGAVSLETGPKTSTRFDRGDGKGGYTIGTQQTFCVGT